MSIIKTISRTALCAVLLLAIVSNTEAATIETWNGPNCEGGGTLVFRDVGRGSCTTFIDQGSIRVSGIDANTRVSVHNQRDCETRSMVSQFYGPACATQGRTKLRAVYIA